MQSSGSAIFEAEEIHIALLQEHVLETMEADAASILELEGIDKDKVTGTD